MSSISILKVITTLNNLGIKVVTSSSLSKILDINNENMLLYRIFNNVLLSDWVSYYLALEYKIDPTPVKFNDEFKKKLS